MILLKLFKHKYKQSNILVRLINKFDFQSTASKTSLAINYCSILNRNNCRFSGIFCHFSHTYCYELKLKSKNVSSLFLLVQSLSLLRRKYSNEKGFTGRFIEKFHKTRTYCNSIFVFGNYRMEDWYVVSMLLTVTILFVIFVRIDLNGYTGGADINRIEEKKKT